MDYNIAIFAPSKIYRQLLLTTRIV